MAKETQSVPHVYATKSRSHQDAKPVSWKKSRVVYDEAAHREFVTGFGRRKAQRRARAERQKAEAVKLKKKEARREKSELLKQLRKRQQLASTGEPVADATVQTFGDVCYKGT